MEHRGIFLCANISLDSLNESNIQNIGVTENGEKENSMLNCILDDIVLGSTRRTVLADAYGSIRRVFIDVAGVIGDTLAINSVLNMRSQTATPFCHLCT